MRSLHQIAAIDGLDAAEATIVAKLTRKLAAHQSGNDLRTMYYMGSNTLRAAGKIGLTIPAQLGKLETVLGWPAKAVTALEHRLNVLGFVAPAGADYGLDEIVEDNNLLVESSMTHTASLIHGTAFVTVSAGDTAAGEPDAVIAARSAREATALWSRRRREITAGLTVNHSHDGEPATASVWLPDRVLVATDTSKGWVVERHPHRLGRVPMEMLSYRPHLEQEFGTPRITKAVMGLTDAAMRTMMRMEATAEFFSFPQRYALGVEEKDFADTFKTYLNRMLALGRDDDGGLPALGEFNSSSPQPHIEQMRALASLFSGETSIPLNYLGIIQDNPASADAIRAAEADLITVAERAMRIYGAGWAGVMRMAAAVRDGGWNPNLSRIETRWRDPATPTNAATAQSVFSLVQVGILPPQSRVTWELLGYDEATILRLEADAARQTAAAAFATEKTQQLAATADTTAAQVNTTWSTSEPVGSAQRRTSRDSPPGN